MTADLSTWTARPRPGLEALDGRYARLEPFDWASHGDGLFAAIGGPANAGLYYHMPVGPYADIAAFGAGFEAARTGGEWQTMAIRDAAAGTALGMVSYMRIRESHGSAEVGCVLFGERLKRTRIATEALYLMALHVFDTLGYRRFEWKCSAENAASMRAAERFGFRYEGTFRNDMVMKGRNRDTAWYAMTDGDWPDIRARFETWLDPHNFDPAGRQKRALIAP